MYALQEMFPGAPIPHLVVEGALGSSSAGAVSPRPERLELSVWRGTTLALLYRASRPHRRELAKPFQFRQRTVRSQAPKQFPNSVVGGPLGKSPELNCVAAVYEKGSRAATVGPAGGNAYGEEPRT